LFSIALYRREHMDNEMESQELDRGYREYAEVQQKLEQVAQQEVARAVVEGEQYLKAFSFFLDKVMR
jgi:hypothetical protein